MVNTIANLNGQSEETNINQVADFLKGHEELEMIIPVMIGLFVTSRFQLRSANALIVNLAIISLFRQIFKKLKTVPILSTEDDRKTQETTMSGLSGLGKGVAIAHSIPGRIRLRIEQLSGDFPFAKRLENLLNNDEYVLSVRINHAAASLIINYDPKNLSDFDLGLKLMSILNAAKQENIKV